MLGVFQFTNHVQTSLVKNQAVAGCVNTDFWLDKITRESRHSLPCKFALGP